MPKVAKAATTLVELAASPELLARVQMSDRGYRLTVDGGAVVVMSEEAYRKLRAEEDRAAVFEGIIDADAGRTMDAKEFFDMLRREQT